MQSVLTLGALWRGILFDLINHNCSMTEIWSELTFSSDAFGGSLWDALLIIMINGFIWGNNLKFSNRKQTKTVKYANLLNKLVTSEQSYPFYAWQCSKH